jgi:uncharacterized membrane protein
MSDAAQPAEDTTRGAALVAYGLYLLAPFNGATAIAGLILAYIKRGDARGTIWEGHFRNLIQVFWISAAVFAAATAVALYAFGGVLFNLAETNGNPPPAVVGMFFLLVPVLWTLGLIWVVWYLYRTMRGFVRALDGRAYSP